MTMRLISARQWALAILSAVLQIFCFPIAGQVPFWRESLAWICLVPLLLAILASGRRHSSAKPMQAATFGYLCGFIWYAGNCYWIYQTMYLYGGLPKPVSLGILLLFALYLGLYHALFAWLIATFRSKYSTGFALLMSPVAWVAVELARARITGFPWDLLGYTQVDSLVLMRLAPFAGVMGLSLLVAAVNALWVAPFLFAKSQARWLTAIAALMATSLAVGTASRFAPILAPPHETATLLQENLSVGAENVGPFETKQQMLTEFARLSLHPPSLAPGDDLPSGGAPKLSSDVVVWPEAPTLFVDSDPVFRAAMGELAKDAEAPVIAESVSVGAKNSTGRFDEYNSASFFLPDGGYAGRYDKMHLVPFGEYTPYKSLFFFAGHLLDDLPFVPGTERRLFDVNGQKYGVFICYESIFGDEVRQFVSGGADVLINISDDGWYGDTSAPWEHLNMVRMRAIENNRWVLRATNTGVTAAIDPSGVIRAQLPRHVRGSIDVGFDFQSNQTFYTRHGDWLAWICAGIVVGALAISLLHAAADAPARSKQ
jgi:apolipoprotein N-acyltransferase